MEESNAIIAVLLILAISISTYFVLSSGAIGAATSQPYVSCCCDILAQDGNQVLVRTQIQAFEPNCTTACGRYSSSGKVFSQEGLCAQNP